MLSSREVRVGFVHAARAFWGAYSLVKPPQAWRSSDRCEGVR